MARVPGLFPPEDISDSLELDGRHAPDSRGSLWDSVLERSLEIGDADRISAAIELAEDGGASAAMLERARNQWRRIAEAGLLEALRAGAEAIPGSDAGEAAVARLTQAAEQASEAGACPETVLKARAVLRSLRRPSAPSRGLSPPRQLPRDHIPDELPNRGSTSHVCKTPSPSRQSPLQRFSPGLQNAFGLDAEVSLPPGAFFQRHDRSFSPARQASPGRVAAQVLGRPLSGDLEAGLPKGRRKSSRSPVGGSAQGSRQSTGECALQ